MPWWKAVLAVVASAGALQALWMRHREELNVRLMRFFRDVGRYKALQRRHASNSQGLLAFLADDQDPLADLQLLDAAEAEDESQLPTWTRSELWTLGNVESDDGALYLAILGRVYDVTEGDKFYGPSGNYRSFAGRDVTYALATGCKRLECVETDWTQLSSDQNAVDSGDTATAFSEEELLEAKKWLSFFHLHDKYPLVGKLEGESFEDLVQQLLEEDEERSGGDPISDTLSEEDMPQ